ncbi:MAG: glycerol-3-phosphate dehydrogenase/oxidase [Gemmatimonadota bacterium]
MILAVKENRSSPAVWSQRGRERAREPAPAGALRAARRESLARRRFDLLVVGGGIIGSGIACEAARAGLSVALVERDDFGSNTSSASSKLIHGGLRYLRLGDVRLVHEAHRERLALGRIVAPQLVRAQPFLLPLYERGPYRPRTVRAGLVLYAALSGFRDGGARLVPPERARALVPPLRADGLRASGLYVDSQTNDSRLCLANVRAAVEAGAVVLNYAEVVELVSASGRLAGATVRDRLERNEFMLTTRAVVNAAGPWVDAVRRLEDPAVGTSVRLSKGAHVLLSLAQPWNAALTVPLDEVRVSFAVPWEGMLLLGTTDEPFEGRPDDVQATEEDLRQIMAEASGALDDRFLRRERVRFAFAGVRVLPLGAGMTATARRETVLARGPRGLLTVAGGKLTTYRRIALSVLAELRGELGLHRIDHRPRPLPGAASPIAVAALLARRYPALPTTVLDHLARLYGSLAAEVLEAGNEEPDLLKPLAPGGPDLVAQAVYAGVSEWACTAEDVLRRRTTVTVRGLESPELKKRVGEILTRAAALGAR